MACLFSQITREVQDYKCLQRPCFYWGLQVQAYIKRSAHAYLWSGVKDTLRHTWFFFSDCDMFSGYHYTLLRSEIDICLLPARKWRQENRYILLWVAWYSKQTFAINLFQEKMSFTGETSTIEKDAKYRSETKNIQFF